MLTSQLTKERALEVFRYDDGKLYWKIRKHKVSIGMEAGCVKAKGYRYVCLDGVHYRVHRIIFLMHHGYMPQIIDHIDNDKLNNKIENLKEISNSENLKKTPIRIMKLQNEEIWRVFLTKHKGYKVLGEYSSLEEATLAKKTFKRSLGIS